MLTSASTKQRCQEFSDFLRSSASGFELDLSGCSLIECIEQMIRVKNRLSEGYGKHFSCLLFNLNYIQKLFGCTISPSQVNELFWTYFISFLTKERKKAFPLYRKNRVQPAKDLCGMVGQTQGPHIRHLRYAENSKLLP